MKKINLLDPLLSSRIAAGEIIERPSSVLREFLDNALDAKADEINVAIDGGGIDLLSVTDNGEGIQKDDLSLIGNRHATSKIKTIDDLYDIATLGFRGEALYSISAVSRLTISTFSSSSKESSTLIIDNGKREDIKDYGVEKGTKVQMENLFFDIPARRSFLKKESTESAACKNLLISKALAFPYVRFTFTQDGALRLNWPKVNTLKERVMYHYRNYGISDSQVNYLEIAGDEFKIRIVCTNSSVKRTDRKEIRIYVNGRPVEDYALQQAVTFGYGELLPGGSYPYAAVFIENKPELVDFNIHPSKKEVKLRNASEIHHSISTLLRNVERVIPEIKVNQYYLDDAERWENSKKISTYSAPMKAISDIENRYIPKSHTNEYSNKPKNKVSDTASTKEYKEKDKAWLEKAMMLKAQSEERRNSENTSHTESLPKEINDNTTEESIIYIGQAFKLFLICQKDDELYIIDQHAAHERVLYDELLEQKSIQTLLIPIKLDLDRSTSDFLEKYAYVYTKLGIMLSKSDNNEWQIDAIPAAAKGIESKIVSFIQEEKLDERELEMELFAVIACHAAIKAGDDIDKWSAESLCKKVFELDEPCCPHGRTFLIRIKEDVLKEMVGRT